MPSIFSRIVAGEIPCHKVAETKDFMAFLDIRPLTYGHTLVIPKQEVDYIFDLENEAYVGLQLFAKWVALGLKKATGKRIGVCVIGLEVPHTHIHLIPFETMEEMNFANPKLSFSQEQLATIAKELAIAVKGA